METELLYFLRSYFVAVFNNRSHDDDGRIGYLPNYSRIIFQDILTLFSSSVSMIKN